MSKTMTFPCLTTSWDDGHPLDFRIADLLEKYGLAGTFYIPKICQTPTMSEPQVRELSQRFEIGAHTINHLFLDTIDDAQAGREIADSKNWVEQTTGKPCPIFCPPGGKFKSQHLQQIEAAGFSAIRTVEMISINKPSQRGGLSIIPTTLQAHPHRFSAYFRNVIKRGGANLPLLIAHTRGTNWPDRARSLLEAAIQRGGVFHLWGHSWEIEEFGQWARRGIDLRIDGAGSVIGSRASATQQLLSPAGVSCAA